MVERFSANFSENCSEAVSGRLWGSRGKFKTRFLDSCLQQLIFGTIDHNSMIVTCSMTTRIFNPTIILESINQPGQLQVELATLEFL